MSGARADVKQNFLSCRRRRVVGGFSNILSPSPFTDEFAVLTDNSTGFVEVWRLGGVDGDGDGGDDSDAGSAAVVAHLDIADDGGGCCSNVCGTRDKICASRTATSCI